MARPRARPRPGKAPARDPGRGLWKALADPTRREILDALRASPLPTGRLAARFELSRFGVMKHLRVLQEAGLVLVEARGRERWNHLNPVPIREIGRRWIRPFEEEDADRLLRLKRLAERGPRKDRKDTMENQALAASTLGVQDVLVEVLIEAPPERVWESLVVEIGEWWHRDFTCGTGPARFHLEARLGGRMFEDWGGGNGLIWGHVHGLRAPEYLLVAGDSAREWGGPARNLMTWRLSREGTTTRLRLEHSLFGRVSEETKAELARGWTFLLRDVLKAYVETGEVPPLSYAPPA